MATAHHHFKVSRACPVEPEYERARAKRDAVRAALETEYVSHAMAIAKILERLDASDRANDIGNACRGRSPVIVSAEALARGISPTFQSARTGVKIARLRDIVRLPRLDGGWFL